MYGPKKQQTFFVTVLQTSISFRSEIEPVPVRRLALLECIVTKICKFHMYDYCKTISLPYVSTILM
jgi:hypothetical protein